MHQPIGIVTRSAEETRIVGASLAPMLMPGDVVSLGGDIGAGKTVFVQGLAAALGVRSRVTSPTFTIVHEYEGRYRLVHVDVYRLESFQEVLDLGFEELLDPEAIMLVEWGEAVAPLLPRRHLEVHISRGEDADEGERMLVFRARGDEWARKLDGMRPMAETLLAASSPDTLERRFVDASELGYGRHRLAPKRPGSEGE
jgi:tRNA threonylcarbamoyladenosine biosynthesis protein TsaE